MERVLVRSGVEGRDPVAAGRLTQEPRGQRALESCHGVEWEDECAAELEGVADEEVDFVTCVSMPHRLCARAPFTNCAKLHHVRAVLHGVHGLALALQRRAIETQHEKIDRRVLSDRLKDRNLPTTLNVGTVLRDIRHAARFASRNNEAIARQSTNEREPCAMDVRTERDEPQAAFASTSSVVRERARLGSALMRS